MPDPAPQPTACPPCRGTGQVISQLGGETTKVSCPWCGGSGRRMSDPEPAAADG